MFPLGAAGPHPPARYGARMVPAHPHENRGNGPHDGRRTSPALPPTARGLGLFGGAFDPPHVTHRRILEAVLACGEVDAVWVLPSGNHPFKGSSMVACGEDRAAMCRIAFGDLPGVAIDPRELHREAPCYTADILQEVLAELHADGRVPPLFWVLGSDNLLKLDKWHQPERVLEQARLIVYPREGAPVDTAPSARRRDLVLDVVADGVNATDIRTSLTQHRPHPELHPRVDAWIRAKGLYGCG